MTNVLYNTFLAALICSPTIGYVCRNYWSRQRLWSILRPARITLADMPYDVIYALSLHLSVQDLCNLRMTSKNLARHLYDRSIWLVVLRDILEIRPIPRLKYALEDLSLEGCIQAATRIAWLNNKFRASNLSLFTHKTFNSNDAKPVLLSGGQYFVALQDREHALAIYGWDDDVDTSHRTHELLVPRSRLPISHWKCFPVSADEVVVAVCSHKKAEDALGNRYTTHVRIYQTNPATGSFAQLDHFILSFRVIFVSLTDQYIAIQGGDLGANYVRFYQERLHTPLMTYPILDHPLSTVRGSLAVVGRSHLLVAQYEALRVFQLPTLQPIARLRVSQVDTPLQTLWEARHQLATFKYPHIHPLSPNQYRIWLGDSVCTLSIDPSAVASPKCSLEQLEVWSRTQREKVSTHDCISSSPFIGMRAKFALQSQGFGFLFSSDLPSRGHVRLRSDRIELLSLVEFPLPDLGDEFVTHISYDEETGRCIMEYQDCQYSGQRIVLSQL